MRSFALGLALIGVAAATIEIRVDPADLRPSTWNDIFSWPSEESSLSWSVRRRQMRHQLLSSSPAMLKKSAAPQEQWFQQTLDHFKPTDKRTWKQRYFTNDTFYRPGGPAFLMIGGEGEANAIWMQEGTWLEYAKQVGAICFQLEHRFYGKSHPLEDLSVKSLVYLSSRQALADLGTFVSAINKEYNFTDTKWIAFGGSYPGSLAAWFRLKYPHLVHGAVSTSGPLLAKADFFEYLQVVSDAFDVTDAKCNPVIQEALAKVQLLTKHRVGWNMITKTFNLCEPFDGTNANDVSNFFENLIGSFEDVVQYNKDNREFEGVKNTNVTIKTLCDIMTGKSSFRASKNDDDFVHYFTRELRELEENLSEVENADDLAEAIGNMGRSLPAPGERTALERLADVVAFVLSMHEEKCFDFKYDKMIKDLREESSSAKGAAMRAWTYQTCTEFGWYQSSNQPNHPYTSSFPDTFFEKQCADIYGPEFDLELLQRAIDATNAEYGAKNISVTNVVFVHGSIDPWHAMGVTADLSNSATSIFISGTAHCANMYPERDEDLPQLKMARKKILEKIKQWLR